MLTWLKKIWKAYRSGAEANSFPISKYGLCMLKHPVSLCEAIYVLDKLLSVEDKIIIQFQTEEEVCVCLHHSLGRQLRNDWGLWGQEIKKSPLYYWFKLQGIWHADDMSSIIIRSYYRKVKGQPIRLQEQVQEFVEYWKAQKYYDKFVGHVFPEERD